MYSTFPKKSRRNPFSTQFGFTADPKANMVYVDEKSHQGILLRPEVMVLISARQGMAEYGTHHVLTTQLAVKQREEGWVRDVRRALRVMRSGDYIRTHLPALMAKRPLQERTEEKDEAMEMVETLVSEDHAVTDDGMTIFF